MSRSSASRSPRRFFTPSDWLSVARTIWRWRLAILIAVVDLVVVGAEIGYWRAPQLLRGGRWFELRELSGFSFGVAHPIVVALVTSQIAILAIWACFGRGQFAVRGLVAVGGTSFCIAVLGAMPNRGYKPEHTEVLLLAQWLLIAALAVVIRISCYKSASAAQTGPHDTWTRKTQFGLSDLFWSTAAVALLLATGPALRVVKTANEWQRVLFGPAMDYGVQLERSVFLGLFVYGSVCGAAAILALWAAWGRHPWRRLVFAIALIWAFSRIAVGLVKAFMIHKLGHTFAYILQPHAHLLWFCLHGGLVFGGLFAFRQRSTSGETGDDQPPEKLLRAAALLICSLIVATAWFFDNLASRVFGDREYRQAVDAIAARHGPAAVMAFPDLVGVWPRRPLTDEDFEYYQRYPMIGGFNFDQGPADDATWEWLKRWPRLRLLGLGNAVTDDDLKHVADMRDLEHI